MENITSGDTIQGARWPEPVQVELVEELNQGAYVRVVGVTRHSRMHVDQLLPREEVAQLRHARVEVSFAASPRQVFLALETRRYRFASLYPTFRSLRREKIELTVGRTKQTENFLMERLKAQNLHVFS